MTRIGSQGYAAAYAYTGATSSQTGIAADQAKAAEVAKTTASSVSVTLSAQAQAALATTLDARSLDTVVADARKSLDALLSAAKATSALKDGKATIDVSGLDRRSLYAVASNQGGSFPIEEQVVASLQLKAGDDAALAAPAASLRVTGDYAGLYKAALTRHEAAGTEEKATLAWQNEKAALVEGLRQATAKPGTAPTGVANDPIPAWLKENGGVVSNPRSRDIDALVSDVRTALDRQYSLATGEGMATDADAGTIDFTRFDDRSLSAIALNKGGQFSEHEAKAAADEVRTRNRDGVSSTWKSAQQSGDSAAFGRTLVSQYVSMSDEEREAVGWTPALYDKMISLQTLSAKLSSMFGEDGTLKTGMSLLDYL
ncbi:hypothetical protein [Caulobacter hibisci]|uniref:Uncharacterized protein n=1 Tax=Caulobacter hibisci TaxID=2035993 RepID=A0ABS0SRZ4_9CAUL|nr:hypothetical protein [Caulobacter hibisci]MBI1682400.1 hypothetical protein [Caulobacter hibisci]